MIDGPQPAKAPAITAGVLAFCGFVWAAPAFAAEPLRLTILDTAGQPLQAAEVEVDARGGPSFLISDAQGGVDLDPGLQAVAKDVQLKITSPGIEPVEVGLSDLLANHMVLRVRRPGATVGEVVVMARKISRAFAPTTLSQLDVVTDPSSHADPILAVNDLPFSTNTVGSAALQLRGNRATISRTYFDLIPVYEFVRGGTIDSATQGGSVFNTGAVSNVESYPSNPPSYLFGASGSAVRLLPPTGATQARTVSLSTVGVGFSDILPTRAGPARYLDVYGGYSNFEPNLSINRTLREDVRESHGRQLGVVGSQEAPGGVDVQFLVQGDWETGAYPLSLQGAANLFRTTGGKGRALASASKELGGVNVTLSSSITRSTSDESLNAFRTRNTNLYYFNTVDVSGTAVSGALNWRAGVADERIDQTSNGIQQYLPSPTPSTFLLRNLVEDRSIYGFASYTINRQLSFSLGSRQTLSSSLPSRTGVQAGASATSLNGRHRLVVMVGQYFGDEIPERAYYGQIDRSVSRQIELNYSYTLPELRYGASFYAIKEHTQPQGAVAASPIGFLEGNVGDQFTGTLRHTSTEGAEIYASAAPTARVEAKVSLSSVRQRTEIAGVEYRGDNNFGFVFRTSAKYQFSNSEILSAAINGRSGSPFTLLENGALQPGGEVTPRLGPLNGQTLPAFWTVNLNYLRKIHDLPRGSSPTLFVGLTNLLDRKNALLRIYTPNLRPIGFQNYPGFQITAGLVWSW